MLRLSVATQTLYAELLEQLTALEAQRSIGQLSGTFTEKTVRGHAYIYFQYSVPGGGKKQVFVGRKDPTLATVIHKFQNEKQEAAQERRQLQQLCAQLAAGGVARGDAASGRVLDHLAQSGLFRIGAVLVGTHAFNLLGALLGVAWEAGHQTEDIDIASDLHVAVPGQKIDLPAVLDRLEMGFLPVPALDPRQPATSFKVRGQRLRVDLLCPAGRRKTSGPVLIKPLQAAAQPLPFLDFLLQNPLRAAVIYGSGVLVNVPDPSRFALHKLILATERSAAWQTKVEKDLQQAGQLLEVLAENRPGDLLVAWEDILKRKWQKHLYAGLEHLKRMQPDIARQTRELLDS